ncbi:MAG: hypothetical protein J07HQX50_00235, partial [Haloquadratum sp. J07HQX50]
MELLLYFGYDCSQRCVITSNVPPSPPFLSCKFINTAHSRRYLASVEIAEVGAEA